MHTHDRFKMIHAYYSQFFYTIENVLKHEIHKCPTFSVQGNIKKVCGAIWKENPGDEVDRFMAPDLSYFQ